MFDRLILLIKIWFTKPIDPTIDKFTGIYRIPGECISEDIDTYDTQEIKKEDTWLDKIRLLIANSLENIGKMSYGNFLNHVWDTFIGIAMCALCLSIAYIGYKIVFATTYVDFCYVERWTYIKEDNPGINPPEPLAEENIVPAKDKNLVIVYELKGNRNFRFDRDIGRFDSLEDAIDGAHKMNCSIEAK